MIIPAIDIMNGKIVRLRNGKTKILEEKNIQKYIDQFKLFSEVNIIDLDAALSQGHNKELIKGLCRKLACNVGGGIRTEEIAMEYLRAGAKHVIIGTKTNAEFLKKFPKHRVIVALDIIGEKIAINGWKDETSWNLKDKILELENYCNAFLITDIKKDGMLNGPNIEIIEKIKSLTNKRIIIAGGISSYEDICAVNKKSCDVIVGTAIYTKKVDIAQAFANILDFSKGLIPTIVKNYYDESILMLSYSSKESILQSFKTKNATYFSRSRNKLWIKGETSDHTQELVHIQTDCDNDALIFTVKQKGAACHSGRYSCFEDKKFSQETLFSYIKNRHAQGNDISYSGKMLDNEEKVKRKIMEEAYEVATANTKENRIWELADLTYFMTLYMIKHDISLNEVINELSLRHKKELSDNINIQTNNTNTTGDASA